MLLEGVRTVRWEAHEEYDTRSWHHFGVGVLEPMCIHFYRVV